MVLSFLRCREERLTFSSASAVEGFEGCVRIYKASFILLSLIFTTFLILPSVIRVITAKAFLTSCYSDRIINDNSSSKKKLIGTQNMCYDLGRLILGCTVEMNYRWL